VAGLTQLWLPTEDVLHDLLGTTRRQLVPQNSLGTTMLQQLPAGGAPVVLR